MSTKWEKQEGNNGVLTFEVSEDVFSTALDKAFKKVVKDVQIPGFRKGKIPRKIFENRFGVESLYQDAVDIVLPDAYVSAVEEAEIEPIDQPEINIDEIEKGKPLTFTATVAVKPEVTLGEYKGLEVEDQTVEITDEDVNEALEAEQEKQAELVLKEEGQIEEGNTAVIDFEGFIDGEPFEGGKGENHSLEIGSGQFIPGFEEQLIGKSAGEEMEVNITFPEEYHEDSLSGKDAVFKVKIHEVKEKELPDLDDEFAKDIDDDVDTLEEYKNKKKEELENQKRQELENEMRETLLNKATDNAEVEIPEVMVETEVDQMVKEFEQQLQGQGMTMEMYSQFSGQNEDDLKNQMKEDAEKRVKTNLTLEAIFASEGLEVTDEDVNKELETMAGMYQTDVEQLKQMLGGNTEALKGDLKYRKAIEFLVDESKVTNE